MPDDDGEKCGETDLRSMKVLVSTDWSPQSGDAESSILITQQLSDLSRSSSIAPDDDRNADCV
jgi:hypothetical protein